MAPAKIYLFNADCSPTLDEDGKQVFVLATQVDMKWNSDGTSMLDGCGNPAWTYRIEPTTTSAPPGPPTPDPIYPPFLPDNKPNWLLIIVAVVVIGLLGWLFV